MISIASSPNRGLPAKAAAGEPANSRQTPADWADGQQANASRRRSDAEAGAGNGRQPTDASRQRKTADISSGRRADGYNSRHDNRRQQAPA